MTGAELDAALAVRGHAVVPALLSAGQCAALAALFDEDVHFRSTIDMARYRFGRGTYRYFDYPLPPQIDALRKRWYERLAPAANAWAAQLGTVGYAASHADFLATCRAAGQRRATPLLLRYGPGDYNCLHQDLYGACVFPLQLVCLLSEPGRDFTGGELVLTEQRPRAQSVPYVVPLRQGDAAVIATQHFPRAGSRGFYRANLRHGVAEITAGRRVTLGILFHDAA